MSDYQIGQQVIHCRDGLAVVVGNTSMADKDYYIVKTVRGSGENIYVPFDRADQIIRFLMSAEEADKLKNVYFGGRLGQYKYYDMDKVVLEALNFLKTL